MIAFALPLVAIAIFYVARMCELATRREMLPGHVHERWSLRIFWLVGTGLWAGAIAEYIGRGHRFAWAWFVAGVACAVASFVIRRRAIAALGRYWSLHVEIRPEHQLVREGPFRWVRHPTYFSMLLEMLAVMLTLQATVTLCVMPFLFLPALAYRLHLEEPALVERFGDAYREYMRTTPCFLPLKWRRTR